MSQPRKHFDVAGDLVQLEFCFSLGDPVPWLDGQPQSCHSLFTLNLSLVWFRISGNFASVGECSSVGRLQEAGESF